MSKFFDIKNIATDRWAGPIVVHLSAGARGYETVEIPAGGTLKCVAEECITTQIRTLTKQKRERPPAIALVEVELSESTAPARVADSEAQPAKSATTEDTSSRRRSKKSRQSDESSSDDSGENNA